jgi:hypothetical protein
MSLRFVLQTAAVSAGVYLLMQKFGDRIPVVGKL